jgi:hypothetical protein
MSDIITQPNKPLICAIVPAYNEERHIAAVLEVLRLTNFLAEIIVVDDGSMDGTSAVVREAAGRDARLRLIRHERNLGKGQAIFTAWAATSASYLVLLDADLHSLTPAHVEALIAPVLERRADMTLGLFSGGHFRTDMSHRLTPFLTGQRALRSELLRHISSEAAAGYGFEVALTVAAGQQNCRTRIVPMKGVWHPPSEFRSERGYWYGRLWRFRMYGQILRAWYLATRWRYSSARAFFSSILKP